MVLTNQIEVFRTGRSYEALMVLNELEAAGVPAYGQEENAGGLVTAMPPTPVQAPGIAWVIKVPEVAVGDARQVIQSLPIEPDQQPGVYHFGPTAQTRRWIQIIAAAFLLAFVASFATDIVRFIEAVFGSANAQ